LPLSKIKLYNYMKNSIPCLALLLALSACNSEDSVELITIEDSAIVAAAQEQSWQTIQPGGDTVCSDGSPYSFHVKPGDQNKLFIFLNGGGACFSAQTCDDREGNQTFIPRADLPQNEPRLQKGVFDLTNPNNPLADWSMVFVSYCTGDAHLGTLNQSYVAEDGYETLIRHQGAANAGSAIDWVEENMSPSKIMVAGASAGALASAVYAGEVAHIYPDADIIQYAGGGSGYRSQAIPVVMAQVGVADAIPAGLYPNIDLSQALFYDFYAMQQDENTSRISFSLYDTDDDQVQKTFRNLLGDTGLLSDDLRRTYSDLDASDIQVSHFLADGDTHTILRFDNFYEEQVGETSFLEWFNELLEGGNPPHVDCLNSDAGC
jgi:hypothetical protein